MARPVSQILQARTTKAIESGFPLVEISHLAEKESWRKEIHRPLYHIHKWWATRLGSVFRAILLGALSPERTDVWSELYKKHDFQGKVVLDPFMGSGTSLGEALKLGCRAVGCDINPVSTFLVRQALTSVNEIELRRAFSELERRVAPEIRHYYRTQDPRTGETIPVLYYFWVLQVDTPEGEVPLFSSFVFSKDAYPKRKPRAQIICPECWQVVEERYDATRLCCPHCGHDFNPQNGPAQGQEVISPSGKRYKIKELVNAQSGPPRPRMYALLALRPNGEKVYLPVAAADFALYREAEERLLREDLPLPAMEVRPGHNTNQARGYNYLRWRDFFNARQLLSLGLLLRTILEIENRPLREQFLCLFSSTLEFNNLFCSFKGEGTGAVRHMFSHHILKPERMPLENSVWGTDKSSGTFSTLFESRLIPAKRYLREPFELHLSTDLLGNMTASGRVVASKSVQVSLVDSWDQFADSDRAALVLNGDSGQLPLPDRSVDAVVTDPPYFDFVHYSELSDFFYAWLSPALKESYSFFDRPDSSHAGEVQQKDPRCFAKQLARVFSECHRVLQDDGLLAFTFHHSKPEGWAAIYEAVVGSGFEITAAHPVHAELRAASPKAAAKEPISLDAILVCRKAGHGEPLASLDVGPRIRDILRRLGSAGIKTSLSDRFVVVASQALVGLGGLRIGFEDVCERISGLASNYSVDGDQVASPAVSTPATAPNS